MALTQQEIDQLVQQAYGGIGRSGFGTDVSQIDQGGYDYWKSQLESGAVAPEAFQGVFGSAVQQAIAQNPQDPYAQYAQGKTYENLVNQAYQGIGRTGFGAEPTQIDQPSYDYWMGQLQSGAVAPEAFQGVFSNAVDQYTAANQTDPLSQQVFQTQAPSRFVGAEQAVDFDSLNKGFEWAQANKVDEDALKKALGEETYNDYAAKYGQGIMQSIQPVLEDNKLDAKEALSVVSQAKQRGLDADEIAKYTDLNPDLVGAFFDTYDKVVSGVVTSAFDKESEVPEADRVKSLLALQSQYGVTDADIAKYSGGNLSENDVSNYFEPVRNFGSEFQKKLNSPNASAKSVVDFIEESKVNPVVAAIYGDKLAELDKSPQINEIRRLADVGTIKDYEGKEYEPLQIMRLAGQISENFDTAKSGGGVFRTSNESIGFNPEEATKLLGKAPGNAAQQVILDMARSLVKQGVTDISQLEKLAKQGQERERASFDDDRVDYSRDKITTNRNVATDWRSKLENKGTGGAFGTTYTGKGGTSYYVFADPETGKPKFSTASFSTSDADILTAVLMIASAIGAPYLANLFSSMLPGAAVTGGAGAAGAAAGIGYVPATAMNTALSGALGGGTISGIASELAGGDFTKGFFAGASGPLLGGIVGAAMPAGVSPGVAKTIGNVASTALRGGNAGSALLSGIAGTAINTAANTALDPILKGLDITPAQLNLATGIVAPLLMGKELNPASIFKTVARAGSARR